MTEEEASAWIAARFGTVAVDRIAAFVAMVVAENERQNLIAPSTIGSIWGRHVVDSAQLIGLAPQTGVWLDIGTGGGFPGMVVALLREGPITLVEPRRKRATFLLDSVARLGIDHRVSVVASRVEQVSLKAAIISARAVASLENLLRAAAACATTETCWLLPRGMLTAVDRALLERQWDGLFHMEQSITDPNSTIVVLKGDGLT